MAVVTENFGQRLKRLRTARRLRVVDLAYAAGLTEGAIRHMESGQTKAATMLAGLGAVRLFLARLDEHEHRLADIERRLEGRP